MKRIPATKVVATRIPYQLYKRVEYLSTRKKETINDWLKRIIIASAQWKGE